MRTKHNVDKKVKGISRRKLINTSPSDDELLFYQVAKSCICNGRVDVFKALIKCNHDSPEQVRDVLSSRNQSKDIQFLKMLVQKYQILLCKKEILTRLYIKYNPGELQGEMIQAGYEMPNIDLEGVSVDSLNLCESIMRDYENTLDVLLDELLGPNVQQTSLHSFRGTIINKLSRLGQIFYEGELYEWRLSNDRQKLEFIHVLGIDLREDVDDIRLYSLIDTMKSVVIDILRAGISSISTRSDQHYSQLSKLLYSKFIISLEKAFHATNENVHQLLLQIRRYQKNIFSTTSPQESKAWEYITILQHYDESTSGHWGAMDTVERIFFVRSIDIENVLRIRDPQSGNTLLTEIVSCMLNSDNSLEREVYLAMVSLLVDNNIVADPMIINDNGESAYSTSRRMSYSTQKRILFNLIDRSVAGAANLSIEPNDINPHLKRAHEFRESYIIGAFELIDKYKIQIKRERTSLEEERVSANRFLRKRKLKHINASLQELSQDEEFINALNSKLARSQFSPESVFHFISAKRQITSISNGLSEELELLRSEYLAQMTSCEYDAINSIPRLTRLLRILNTSTLGGLEGDDYQCDLDRTDLEVDETVFDKDHGAGSSIVCEGKQDISDSRVLVDNNLNFNQSKSLVLFFNTKNRNRRRADTLKQKYSHGRCAATYASETQCNDSSDDDSSDVQTMSSESHEDTSSYERGFRLRSNTCS